MIYLAAPIFQKNNSLTVSFLHPKGAHPSALSHPNPISTFLITGLLGSGKTTALQHFIQQKPAGEIWAIVINEFGEIDIDGAILNHHSSADLMIKSVAGGCICCTAGHQLSQAIQNLISEHPNLDKLWIEPTGLGHPAGVVDTLKQLPQIKLQTTLGVVTPKQLTLQRWQKSAVMRDIVTLADGILLSQTDLATAEQISESQQILTSLYPAKSQIWQDYESISIEQLSKLPKIGFQIYQSSHLQRPLQTLEFRQPTEHINRLWLQIDTQTQQIKAIGCTFLSKVIFNRNLLKSFFVELHTQFQKVPRAKGVIRTGKEWQLLQWQGEQLRLTDFAWRQDSRIEFLVEDGDLVISQNEQPLPAGIKSLLAQLETCISRRLSTE